MSKGRFSERLAEFYTTFRGSPLFLLVLVLTVGSWIALHFLLGTDSDWGALNLFLSFEASITTALLIKQVEDSDRLRKQLEETRAEQLRNIQRLEERHAKELGYTRRLLEAVLKSAEIVPEEEL